jgi:hypothetical protein
MKAIRFSFFRKLAPKPYAQAMVEFAIALPLLLLILYGVIELARIAFIFSSTSNASRAAARYGAGAGENSDGTPHYLDCDGIREIAKQSAYVTDFSEINITYDRGVNSDGTQIPIAGIDPDPSVDSCSSENFNVRNGDRIVVQVSANYEPIVSIIPIDPIEIVSSNARTFVVSIPILGSSVPLAFLAETSTPSRVPNSSPTATSAPTLFFTPTRVAIDLTQFAYNLTNRPTATLTLTPSVTPPPTASPSTTPTRILCNGVTSIQNGALSYKNNFIQMELYNNTGYPIEVSEVYLEWNHDKGHQGDDTSLHLTSVSLDTWQWQGNIWAPSQPIPAYHPIIPTGSSRISFGFNQTYDILDGTERVVMYPLTPGCEAYLIDSKNK